MGRRPSRRGQGHFFKLPRAMVNSDAWRGLSHSARTVFCALAVKFNGANHNDLSLPHRELKTDYGMNTTTIKRAFDQLEEAGFIDVVRPGGLEQRCTIFALSDRWYTGLKAR